MKSEVTATRPVWMGPIAFFLFITLRRTKWLGSAGRGYRDFGAFFTEHRRFGTPLPQQWATPALMDKLREEGFMPTANNPTTIQLNGQAYKAELAEGGFVKLTRV